MYVIVADHPHTSCRPFVVGGVVTSVVRSFLPFSHVGEPWCPSVGSCIMKSSEKAFLPGYLSSLQDSEGKKWYLEKLSVFGGLHSYETARNEWLDDVDLWPSVTSMHIGIYLLVKKKLSVGGLK